MNKQNLIKLENQICFPFYAISRKITQQYTPYLKKLELTYPQYLVLLVLWEYPLIKTSDLGNKLYLNTNTLTPLLQRMETQKLIIRSKSTDDNRVTIIEATNKAIELKEKAYEIPQMILEEISCNEFNLEKLKNFKETLDNLLKSIDQ